MDLLELAQYTLLATVIAGVTELIKRLRAKDYWTTLTIASAAVVGLVFGLFHVEGLTPVLGLAAGFGTSGFVTVLGSLGNKSTPAPTAPVVK